MIAILRNAARRWANRRLVSEADQLRNKLISAEAAVERHEQTATGATNACNDAGRKLLQANAYNAELRDELKFKDDQIERQADVFDEYRAEIDRLRRQVFHLEQTIIAMSAAKGDGWDDVVAAGLNTPETRQP